MDHPYQDKCSENHSLSYYSIYYDYVLVQLWQQMMNIWFCKQPPVGQKELTMSNGKRNESEINLIILSIILKIE